MNNPKKNNKLYYKKNLTRNLQKILFKKYVNLKCKCGNTILNHN